MASDRVTHKKRKIEVRQTDEEERTGAGEDLALYIDGDYVPTRRHPSGRFYTHRLPYTEYESLTELGKDLIDKSQA